MEIMVNEPQSLGVAGATGPGGARGSRSGSMGSDPAAGEAGRENYLDSLSNHWLSLDCFESDIIFFVNAKTGRILVDCGVMSWPIQEE